MRRLAAILAAAMLAAAPMPGAGQAGRAPSAPSWQVDWGDQYCALVRLPDEATRFAVGFRVLPGSDSPSIVITRGGPDPAPEGITAVALAPANRMFQVAATSEQRDGGRFVTVLGGLHDDFWDALRSAGELRLIAGSQVRRRIALAHTAPAVAALRECTSRVMREWGLDEAALAALRERPETTNRYGLSNEDYPPGATMAGRQGRVVLRIDVSAAGRATGCAVVGSSGSEPLDSAACRAVVRRGRFRPALGADGQPTAARIVGAVTWLMPSLP